MILVVGCPSVGETIRRATAYLVKQQRKVANGKHNL